MRIVTIDFSRFLRILAIVSKRSLSSFKIISDIWRFEKYLRNKETAIRHFVGCSSSSVVHDTSDLTSEIIALRLRNINFAVDSVVPEYFNVTDLGNPQYGGRTRAEWRRRSNWELCQWWKLFVALIRRPRILAQIEIFKTVTRRIELSQ